LTANLRECLTAPSVRAVRSKQTIIKGGSSDSDETAFAVIPEGPSSPKLVMTLTPVTKRPQTSRNALLSTPELTAASSHRDDREAGDGERMPGAALSPPFLRTLLLFEVEDRTPETALRSLVKMLSSSRRALVDSPPRRGSLPV
jgi:hypothetical protein